jgi:uncharacterized membrane protein
VAVTKLKSVNFMLIVFFLQSVFYVSLFFNIPVARQIIGFLYLTFVPGFIIVKLLKLDELDGLETVLFSVGFSVAFLVLAGLLANEFCILLGVSKPLSLVPLTIILTSLILVGAMLVSLRNEDVKLLRVETLGLSPLTLVFAVFPVLSVVGAFLVNASGNSSILLFMILSIAILLAFGVLSKRFVPPKLYPFAILMISAALLFHSSLFSSYIGGHDIHLEYYLFKLTQNNAYWNSTAFFTQFTYGELNSMLSVTVLPTIYSNTLNMEATWILKIVYPLIFSFLPLALYKMWQTNTDKKIAFTSAFLLMGEITFHSEMLALARQMIAELFVVLLFLVLLDKKMNSTNAKICFAIFSVSLVVSHYAVSTIFLFFIFFAWLYMFLAGKKPRNLTLSLVALYFALMFSWYVYTSTSASFESVLWFGDRIYGSLGNFFNPSSRGKGVMQGLGMQTAQFPLQIVSRIFAYATEIFIVIGFIASIARWKKRVTNREYRLFSAASMGLLAMCILLPGFAGALRMERLYHLALFFLAPFFAIGAEAFTGFFSRRKDKLYSSILISFILVPYFLFQTNFAYEVAGTQSWSVPLSNYRMNPVNLASGGHVNQQDVVGAQWMLEKVGFSDTSIYADITSKDHVLTSYGLVYRGIVEELSNVTVLRPSAFIYFDKINVVYGIVVGKYVWNITQISYNLNELDKVYSNGGSEIYKSNENTAQLKR